MTSRTTDARDLREYSRAEAVVFLKTDGPFGGLSNMAAGYPLLVNGIRIRTSEALYQACRFPHLPAVQKLVIETASPITAKMKSKPYRSQSRADWESIKVPVMRWCLRVKVAQHWERFGDLLSRTGDRPIVEESARDAFWGANPRGAELLVGMNVLGRLLMELRQQLDGPERETFRIANPLAIGDFLLYGEPIREVQPATPGQRATLVDLGHGLPIQQQLEFTMPTATNQCERPATPSDRDVEKKVTRYPKRLIEVDLPIREISAHARREKSIRHGHISTLHIWWARRPLAACRAVLCAALWPDPVDEGCPPAFREAAASALGAFAEWVRSDLKLAELCKGHWSRWNRTDAASLRPEDPAAWFDMRYALLDFIADFANWDASTVPAFLETARTLTQAAHEALGGAPGTRPLVVDPFAGGGSIPLEALRVGADAFASDLNPVAVLLNKVVLEYIPKYGNAEITMPDAEDRERTFHGLAEAVRYWGGWIKEQAEKELGQFYPKDPDGATPIAYLWARTITCEGPGCGAEVPLIRSLWLAKKPGRSVALQVTGVQGPASGVRDGSKPRVDIEIIQQREGRWVAQADSERVIERPSFDGTVKRGSATCPCCGYTTPVARVREQLKPRRGGAADARMLCVVTTRPGQQGRCYRLPTERDLEAVRNAAAELERRKREHSGELSLVPNELISLNEIRRISVPIYGMTTWGDLFTPRQALALTSLAQLVGKTTATVTSAKQSGPTATPGVALVRTALALAVDRQADASSSVCRWHLTGEKHTGTFGRQAVPMVWDFSEVSVLSTATGGLPGALDWVVRVLDQAGLDGPATGGVARASACGHPLPDDFAHAFITDPPYYDSVPYAYLSDFFYVWLKRSLRDVYPGFFDETGAPKSEEIVVDRPHVLSTSTKDVAFYERELTRAFAEGRRVLRPDGIGTVVFASKTTASWEAVLQAVIDGGWTLTASWPIDTEMESRVAAQGQARLASSIHLVCRPRENPDGSLRTDDVGDWRDVLAELPVRIHEWMPRLASEGVVGADAIFACLGPALEIFSRYPRVEKASGEPVTLREYLEHVWAAVAREALGMIFESADASGFEEDARLTAMWLWTLAAGSQGTGDDGAGTAEDEEGQDEEEGGKPPKLKGFVLEYDAARKIAQGLGAHLEELTSLVQVKGDTARLLPVAEREAALFGRATAATSAMPKGTKRDLSPLFADQERAVARERGQELLADEAVKTGASALDRVHQAMLLFGRGQSEALRRFLVEQGIGHDERFWRLAQALSQLYPSTTEEKRWVDGLLARKKGLGL